jgi:hypothetical protein
MHTPSNHSHSRGKAMQLENNKNIIREIANINTQISIRKKITCTQQKDVMALFE